MNRLSLAVVLVMVACSGGSGLVERATVTISYGVGESQFGELTVPGGAGPFPVVVLIHGGFWLDRYGLDLMRPLADDLADRGYAVWNIEYRRIGADGGGWPTTFEDVGAAVDHLALISDERRLDLDKLVVVGHSAGGHLAMWSAGREALVPGAPGSEPLVVPVLVIAQAPVADLYGAAESGLGRGAVSALLGGLPDARPERYVIASPRPDVAVEIVIVVGGDDGIVPLEISVPQWFDGAVITIESADHFSLIDPDHESWLEVVSILSR